MRNTKYIELNAQQLDVMMPSILHGYRRQDQKADTNPTEPFVTVIGATSQSAEAYIRSMLVGPKPGSFACFGSDTYYHDTEEYNPQDVILILPEVEYVSTESMRRIARQIDRLRRCSRGALIFFGGDTLAPYHAALYAWWLQEDAPFNLYRAGSGGPFPIDPVYFTREHYSRYTRIPGYNYRTLPQIMHDNIVFNDELACLSGEALSQLMYRFMEDHPNLRRWVTPTIAKKIFEYREWLDDLDSPEDEKCDTSETADHHSFETLGDADRDGFTIYNEHGPVPITFYDNNGNDKFAALLRTKLEQQKPLRKQKPKSGTK